MYPTFDIVADKLAETGYAILDEFLSEQEVANILELADFKNGLLQFQKAGIGKLQGKQINESIRGDFIQWIDKEKTEAPISAYLRRVEELMRHINQNLFLSLKDIEVHKTIYPAGSFYKRHLDQFRADDHRKLSIICYLNTNWKETEGGQLRMYLEDGFKDILPTAGRLVCFRSDKIEHEVLAATRNRLSLTGWMLDQWAGLKHL